MKFQPTYKIKQALPSGEGLVIFLIVGLTSKGKMYTSSMDFIFLKSVQYIKTYGHLHV